MTVMTRRDVRGLRAQVRRFAHEHGCDEVQSLITHHERYGEVDVSRLPAETAAWVTEVYVVLSQELAALRRAYCEARALERGSPTLTRTITGAALSHILGVLHDLHRQPADFGLPVGADWSFQVMRLSDAWHGSLHTERYMVDFWGPPALLARVVEALERKLFP